MRVTEVLVHIKLVRFPLIVLVFVHGGISGKYRRAVIEIDRDVAFQTDRKAEIRACWKEDGSAAFRYGSIDRFVY